MTHRNSFLPALVLFSLLAACQPPAPIPVYQVADRGMDADDDGAADVDDPCPRDAEDGLAPRANDGCPAEDPDQDGIGRAQDRCPDSKEDGLSPSPGDGCPSSDADHDGVADQRDKCAGRGEDNLPPDPGDGCPSDDRDNDKIANSVDKCPEQAESPNGYRDQDGCPDQPPSDDRVVYDDVSHEIYVPPTRRIAFFEGSSAIQPTAKTTLDEIAAVMLQRPEISRLEVEAHTAGPGDDAMHVRISDARSKAITDELMARRDLSPSRHWLQDTAGSTEETACFSKR
jgi:hypothetical protein